MIASQASVLDKKIFQGEDEKIIHDAIFLNKFNL